MAKIIALAYDERAHRIICAVEKAPGDNGLVLVVDGKAAPGAFQPSIYGFLYQHTDGEWGFPSTPPIYLGYGVHAVGVSYRQPMLTTGAVTVGKPPSTLGPGPIDMETVLACLWAAGFRTVDQLLTPLAIAAAESAFYPTARNWLPGSGFRTMTSPLGVVGPDAAWNDDHTQQGHSDRGLFQINSKAWPQYADSVTDDPAAACGAIYVMSKQGTDWSPWDATVDHYTSFFDNKVHGLGPLRPVIVAFLATKS